MRGDQWVWVKNVLMPYDAGDISFWQAMTYEYQVFGHSHILQLFVFWFNSEFLSQSLRVDSFIGILSVLAIFAVFIRHLYLRQSPLLITLFTATVLSTILFSSANSSVFGWSLLQFQYLYLLIAIIYLHQFPSLMNGKLIPLFSACLFVFLFGDAIGFAAIAATILYSLVLSFFDKSLWRRCLNYIAFITLTSIVLFFLFKGGRVVPHTSFLEFAGFSLKNPIDIVDGILKSSAMMFVYLRTSDTISMIGFLKTYQLGIILSSVWLIMGAYAVFKIKDKSTIAFPISLTLTGLIFAIGVLKSRIVLFGPETMLTGRYYQFYTLVGFGIVLLVAKWASENKSHISSAAAIISGLCIIGINLYESHDFMSKMHYHEAYFKKRVELVYAYGATHSEEDKAEIMDVIRGSCRLDGCSSQIEYMQRKKINLFSE